MKLWAFEGVETDWVAADSVGEARDTMKSHYGIGDDDIDGSYESISEVAPDDVVFYTDAVDAETEEAITTTAAKMMVGKTRPFVVGSTCQ